MCVCEYKHEDQSYMNLCSTQKDNQIYAGVPRLPINSDFDKITLQLNENKKFHSSLSNKYGHR